MPGRSPEATRAKLLDAGAALFAARGFRGTTVRDIAEKAGVNLAAGHYHFGSKRELYLQVFREHFARVRAELRARGGAPDPAQLARLSPGEAETVLHTRIQAMLAHAMGSPPELAGSLMQREMADPSEALPVIVREFIRPLMDELEAIVTRLAPDIAPAERQRCAMSIVGQALFYQFAMPAVLRLHGRRRYTSEDARVVADHITRFSLGGLSASRTPPEKPARAR